MSKNGQIEKIALAIPAGWKVAWNTFCHVSLEEALQREGKAGALNSYFTEDLLLLQRLNKELSLDVGWNPDMDLSGQYELCVHKKDEEEPVLEYASRSSQEIVERINGLLANYAEGESLIPLRIATGWEVRLNHWIKDLDKMEFAALPGEERNGHIIFSAARYLYGWIQITVRYHKEFNSSFFTLVVEQENDEDFYKKISVDDMARAIFVLENWLELAHFLDTDRLVDG